MQTCLSLVCLTRLEGAREDILVEELKCRVKEVKHEVYRVDFAVGELEVEPGEGDFFGVMVKELSLKSKGCRLEKEML